MPSRRRLSRRHVLSTLTVAAGGMAGAALLAACGGAAAAVTQASTASAATSASAATATSASVATALASTSTAAPAAAQPASAGKSFTFWNDIGASNEKPYAQLQQQFNQQAGIKINQQIFQLSDMYSKLQLAVPAGQGPDLTILLTPDIPHFASIGLIDSIDAALLKQNNIQQSDYATSTWNGGIYKGTRYTITQDVVFYLLFLNDTMFKNAGLTSGSDKPKPPTTQAEVLDAAKKLSTNGNYGFSFGGGADAYSFEMLLWQNGTNVFNSDFTKCLLGGAPALEVGNFWGSLNPQLKVAPPDGIDLTNAFIAGKLGMWINGSWNKSGLDAAKIPYTVALTPTFFKNPTTWSIGHEFAFPKPKSGNGAQNDAVWQFIDFMIKNGATWTVQGGVLAANNTVYNDPQLADDPVIQTFIQQSKTWQVGQPTEKWEPAESKINPAVDAIYLGKQQASSALPTLAQQIDSM